MTIDKEFVIERLKIRAENKNDPHFKMLEEIKNQHKKLRMHVHGTNVIEYIEKLEALENQTKINLRKRLSRSNRSLFADVLRPVDKIFSKQGGSKEYHIKIESKLKNFTDILSKINKGHSFMKWLKTYFVDKYVIDPNGFFLVEYKNGIAYPTYKSILTVADYTQVGQSIGYVIFEPEIIKVKNKEAITIVRVYDDEADYTYQIDLEKWTISETNETFPNPWKKVPAVLCSDIEDTLTGFKQTPIYEQIEDADEYLRINSVNTLQYYHHGFAKFWKVGTPCKKCDGAGSVTIKGQGDVYVDATCPSCGGKKFAEKEDVSDVTYISVPPDGSKGIVPDIMGFITPPIESLKALDDKLKSMRDVIYHSHWGTVISRDNKDQTAFEVSINTQPMQDRLNGYTDSLENIESLIVDLIGYFYLQNGYGGSSINYGRNYVIKGADELLDSYYKSKEKKASYTILNEKLLKYYHAQYSNDMRGLDISLKLMQVEPMVHNTLDETKSLGIPPEMYSQKIYYNDWLTNTKKEDLYKLSTEELKISLKQYSDEREKQTNKVPGVPGTD